MIIDAGRLDRSLELLAATTIIDEMRQPVATFAPIATLRGQRLEIRTQDAARAGGRETFTLARFLIRWRANITTNMRVLTGGKLYDIKAIDEPDRRSSLILTLEEAIR